MSEWLIGSENDSLCALPNWTDWPLRMLKTLFVSLQYILPHHGISRLVGRLAHSERRWLSQRFIRLFARRYQVNMAEAAQPDLAAYPSFNAFFTRALRSDARNLQQAANLPPDALICPVDGAVSQAGTIQADRIFQAKGQHFTTQELLGRDDRTAPTEYDQGRFATLYLSPRDYHRIHMPCDGTLVRMIHVPGRLFSVNPATAERVPRLFARNERLVCEFQTPHGPMALVLVGAMIVASIGTTWAGTVAPNGSRDVRSWHYGADAPRFRRGDEMGRFLLGSTVVMLTPADAPAWEAELQATQPVQVGQPLNGQSG